METEKTRNTQTPPRKTATEAATPAAVVPGTLEHREPVRRARVTAEQSAARLRRIEWESFINE